MKGILKKLEGDRIIWMAIGILFVASFLTVYSSTGTLAYKYREGNTLFYLFRHMAFQVGGLVLIFVVHKISPSVFSKLARLLFYIAIALLALTLMLGVTKNDASRWLRVPGLGVAFQTSDFAKFALIMFVAQILAQHQKKKRELEKSFKTIMIAVAVTCGLILPENFSTAALLFLTVLIVMYVGRMDVKLIYSAIGLAFIGTVLFVLFALVSPDSGRVGTWKSRIESFIDPSDSKGNYQADQAKIAVATGGVLGKLPGNSIQRNFLPHPYSDFIYAIIIEEYGLVGGVIILLLYTFILVRTGKILGKCTSSFSALLGVGLAFSLVLQAFVNMAVCVNLIPVTGQPLPFVSMGGTSILFSSMALGILLSISREVENNRKGMAIKSVV